MNRIVYKVLKILPDKIYIKLQYRYLTKKKLNLNNPKRYNEKLQWLKLYDRKAEYTIFVDKYEVKKYVSQIIGNQYIIPTIDVWHNAKCINFEKLPQQFVLKCNHDSKSVIVCKDKKKINKAEIIKKLNSCLKNNHYYYGREWPYKNVQPIIMAEKYLEDSNGLLPDYKVMCFNGEPKLIQLHQGRFTDDYTHDIYDCNWIKQDFNQKREKNSTKDYPKPVFLEEMLELSRKLSKNIPHIRVDWYYVDNQLYFGELTFYDAAGYLDFVPDKYNEIIGEWIKLPKGE